MPWLAMAVLLIIWEIACIVFEVPEIILPRPTKVFTVFVARFDILMAFCWDTLWTTVIGFLLAIAGGLLLGLAIGASPFVYSGLYPLLIAFNAIPKVAIVPILMIWVGVGSLPAVITAFVISFFPIVVNVATGLATIEPEMRDVLRSLGATRTEILTKVGIPRAMPYLFASLKVAITLAFIGSVISETVGGNQRHRLPDAVGRRAQRRAHDLRRPVRHRHHGRADVRRLRPGREAHDPLGVPRRDRGLGKDRFGDDAQRFDGHAAQQHRADLMPLAGLLPGLQAILDALGAADQRGLVHQGVGNRRDRLGAPAGEKGVLDLQRQPLRSRGAW